MKELKPGIQPTTTDSAGEQIIRVKGRDSQAVAPCPLTTLLAQKIRILARDDVEVAFRLYDSKFVCLRPGGCLCYPEDDVPLGIDIDNPQNRG